MNEPRLMFIIPNLFRGGAEYQLLELVRGLKAHDACRIKVLTFYSERTDLYPLSYYSDILECGVELGSLFDEVISGKQVLKPLEAEIEAYQPDVIHSYLEANWYCIFAKRPAHTKLFLGIRNILDLSLPKRLMIFTMQHRVTAFVANSRTVINDFARKTKILPAKRKYIYNGVDFSRFTAVAGQGGDRTQLGLTPEDLIFITVSNMHMHSKGHKYLIEAFARYAGQNPQAHLLLCGDGELRPEFETQARSAGIEEQVRFMGIVDEVENLLAIADCYVSSSLREGFSNSIIEAMAVGLPVVATRVGAADEFITNGENGFLIPPADSEALSTALNAVPELIHDKQEQIQTKQQAIRADLTVDKLIERHFNLYGLSCGS